MFPIIDLHCHPALKIYLFNRDITKKHYPLSDFLPIGMHVDLPGMEEANVQVILNYHYVPEAGLGSLSKAKGLFQLLKKLGSEIIDKFEPDDDQDGAYSRTLMSMDLLNGQLLDGSGDYNVAVARNLSEMEQAMHKGKKVVLHCLEGGHHLGKGLSGSADYIKRLEHLRGMGLCMLTLTHFFNNDLCDSGGGMSPNVGKRVGYTVPPPLHGGLSGNGKEIVNWCQDNGVIIDLVHATVAARNQVYDILDERRKNGLPVRPVVFSHAGIRELAGKNMENSADPLILPDLAEVKKVRKYGGVIALILMNYWLVGIEEDNPFKLDKGITCFLDTIKFVRDHTGDFENIAIGTDLDGFTQVPDDLVHIRKLGALSEAIAREFGGEAARKICYDNALRVIRAGWH